MELSPARWTRRRSLHIVEHELDRIEERVICWKKYADDADAAEVMVDLGMPVNERSIQDPY